MKAYVDYADGTRRWYYGNFFIDRPSTIAQKRATGLGHGFNYAVFERGNETRRCAERIGVYRTFSDAVGSLLAGTNETPNS